jgi:hypothetical protein
MIGSCFDYFVGEPKRRVAAKRALETENQRDAEIMQKAASVGALDFLVVFKQSGFKDGRDGLLDFAQFGNAQLRSDMKKATEELRQAEEDYKRANEINKPDIQPHINKAQARITEIQRQIETVQATIAKNTYLRRDYTYSTSNEQRDGNQSSCTIRIPSVLNGRFTNTKVAFFTPNVTLVGEVEYRKGQWGRDGNIEFTVSGSTESLKELVNNSNKCRATIQFNNLRRSSDPNSVEANILAIDIVKAP